MEQSDLIFNKILKYACFYSADSAWSDGIVVKACKCGRKPVGTIWFGDKNDLYRATFMCKKCLTESVDCLFWAT